MTAAKRPRSRSRRRRARADVLPELDQDEAASLFAAHFRDISHAWREATFAVLVDTPWGSHVLALGRDSLAEWSKMSPEALREMVRGNDVEYEITMHALQCFRHHQQCSELGLAAFVIRLGGDKQWSSAVAHAMPMTAGGQA